MIESEEQSGLITKFSPSGWENWFLKSAKKSCDKWGDKILKVSFSQCEPKQEPDKNEKRFGLLHKTERNNEERMRYEQEDQIELE